VFVSTAEGFVRDLPPEQVAVPSVSELSRDAFVAGVTGTVFVREHIKLNLLHPARLEEDDAEAQVRQVNGRCFATWHGAGAALLLCVVPRFLQACEVRPATVTQLPTGSKVNSAAQLTVWRDGHRVCAGAHQAQSAAPCTARR
jgi:hypothetical protein